MNLSFILYMKKYEPLIPRVLELIGEDGLAQELEGILRKHEGIARRERKAGRVERAATLVAGRSRTGGEPVERLAARVALEQNLSQASVYRMAAMLAGEGIPLRAAPVLREMERIKRGIY